MSPKEVPSERRPPESAAEAAQRLATIVEAAERAASRVIDDAEQQAHRRLEEASDRADRLIAERLRALADELDPPGAGEGPTTPHLKPVEEVPEVGEEPPPRRRSGSAGARLLAAQMAVSGASRKEIEARLRNGFDIQDTDEILDAILGREE